MPQASLELIDAICERLAQLLECDEAGWPESARWLDHLSSDDGIDLCTDYASPRKWAESAVQALDGYIDPKRFPEGRASLESYETAEDLFWMIFPNWRRTGL